MSDEADMARTIAVMRGAMNDALTAAAFIAARGSDHFQGNEACKLFSDARAAIEALRNHPAMLALASASLRGRL